MSYNAKNFTEQGGDITHIGGTLVVDEGGSVEGLPSPALPFVFLPLDETGSCGLPFGELWDLFYNQKKMVFFTRETDNGSDLSREILLATQMRLEHSSNYVLYVKNISSGDDAGAGIGSADTQPSIH